LGTYRDLKNYDEFIFISRIQKKNKNICFIFNRKKTRGEKKTKEPPPKKNPKKVTSSNHLRTVPCDMLKFLLGNESMIGIS
jgi:hypothetical protein